MKRTILSMAVMGLCSLLGSFLAVSLMKGEPVQAQEGGAGAIKATEFSLVDKDGRVLIYMDADDNGGGRFSMLDKKGKVRMQASCSAGGVISLLDDKGNPRYTVTQQDDGSIMEFFSDDKGKQRFMTTAKADGDVLLLMAGPKGEQYITMMGGPEQASTLILTSPDGKSTGTFFARNDQATMQLACNKGQMLSAVMEDGRPVFALSKDDKLRMRSMLGTDGKPELIFLNEKRESVWSAGK
jgi:hypothetical protein